MTKLTMTSLGFLLAAAAVAQSGDTSTAPSEVSQLQEQLCQRAHLVGGPLDSYLEGVGLTDPSARARAIDLFESLRQAHSELPESYVKLAVLMAAEGGSGVSAEAAEATLFVLEGCLPGEESAGSSPEPSEAEASVAEEPAVVVESAPPVEPESEEEPVSTTESVPGIEPASPPATSATPQPAPAVAKAPASPQAPEPSRATLRDPREMFLEAVALADRGEVAEAKAIFQKLTATYPQLPEPHINLAVLLLAEGNGGGATRAAEAGLLLHPICRAGFELDMLRDLGAYTKAKLADLGRESGRRVVGPEWVPSADDAAPEIRVVAETVEGWAAALKSGQIEDYLRFYSAGFQPINDENRQIWEGRRRVQLGEARFSKVEVVDLSVDLPIPGTAVAEFTLSTSDGGVFIRREKTLELRQEGSVWRIVAEQPGD